jgi:hypothetical protein
MDCDEKQQIPEVDTRNVGIAGDDLEKPQPSVERHSPGIIDGDCHKCGLLSVFR